MRSRSTGIMLIEEPVENSNDSDFNDLEDSNEGRDLGLGEEPRSLLNYLCTQCWRVARSYFRLMLGLPLHMELTLHDCLISVGHGLNCHRSKASDLRDQLSK